MGPESRLSRASLDLRLVKFEGKSPKVSALSADIPVLRRVSAETGSITTAAEHGRGIGPDEASSKAMDDDTGETLLPE